MIINFNNLTGIVIQPLNDEIIGGCTHLEITEDEKNNILQAFAVRKLAYVESNVLKIKDNPVVIQERVGEVDEELMKIDQKKTRALSDFALHGDNTKLQELEAQAVPLRNERAALMAKLEAL